MHLNTEERPDMLHDVRTDSTLNYSKLLDIDRSPDGIANVSGRMLVTDERPDALLCRPDGKLGIRLLLRCKLRRVFLESENFLLDACDTDTYHIKAISILEK
jgi:hypothetical protein